RSTAPPLRSASEMDTRTHTSNTVLPAQQALVHTGFGPHEWGVCPVSFGSVAPYGDELSAHPTARFVLARQGNRAGFAPRAVAELHRAPMLADASAASGGARPL